jgi:hypothetical protein
VATKKAATSAGFGFGNLKDFLPGGKKYVKPGSFTPYVSPVAPPAGYYDPNIDAQVGATQRGLGDTMEDIGTAGRRDTSDYLLQSAALGRQQTRGTQDLQVQEDGTVRSYDRAGQDLGVREADTTRSFDRSGADLDQQQARGTEDYGRSVQALLQSYQRLQGQQSQQQRAAGLSSGSAALQAAARRKANEATDQQPLDLGQSRLLQDVGTSRSRLGEDRTSAMDAIGLDRTRLGEDRTTDLTAIGTARTRLGEDSGDAMGQLDLAMAPPSASNPLGGRSFQDRTTQLTRAQREAAQFGIDAGQQRFNEAAQNGYTLPNRGEVGGAPSNEFQDAQGSYRVIQRGGISQRVNPDGSVRPMSAAELAAAAARQRRAAIAGSTAALAAARKAR